MKKISLFGIVCLALVFFSCGGRELERDVSLVNSTDSTLSITECSLGGDFSLPVDIEAGDSRTVVVRGASESVSFKVTFSDQNYSVSTGYVQDSSDISVEFTSSDDGGLYATINAGDSSNAATVSRIQD